MPAGPAPMIATCTRMGPPLPRRRFDASRGSRGVRFLQRRLRAKPPARRSGISGEPKLKVVMAGQGAFGIKHLEAMQKIDGIEVVSLVGGSAQSTQDVAERFKIPHW